MYQEEGQNLPLANDSAVTCFSPKKVSPTRPAGVKSISSAPTHILWPCSAPSSPFEASPHYPPLLKENQRAISTVAHQLLRLIPEPPFNSYPTLYCTCHSSAPLFVSICCPSKPCAHAYNLFLPQTIHSNDSNNPGLI